jgi:hypothetical protein
MLRRREMTQWAISDISHCGKALPISCRQIQLAGTIDREGQ